MARDPLARIPWWQVQAVLGDADDGPSFAYTIGLADRGLPELHIWARPSLGEDPGHDWSFSPRDLTHLLNSLASRLAEGRLDVGDVWEESYDAGLVTVRFRLDAAEDAESLEALQVRGSPVCPVRWSLHRAPAGAPTPLDDAARARATTAFTRLVSAAPEVAAPPGWEVPAVPSWDPEQRWGPLAPLVAARAARLVDAGPEQLVDLLNLAVPLFEEHAMGEPIVVAQAVARSAGRGRAVGALLADAAELVEGLGVSWAVPAWRAAYAWFNADGSEPTPESLVRHLVRIVVQPWLVTTAVEDLLDRPARLHGLGPVTAALAGTRACPPGPDWCAADHVVDAIRRVVVRAGAASLLDAVINWQTGFDESHTTARGQIAARAVTSAAMFPDFRSTLPARLLRELTSAQLRRRVDDWAVQDWLTTLATVLIHRAVLSEKTVAAVLQCGGTMPGLAAVVNQPLATEAGKR
ncbi:hypothetical protein [Nocardioides sp.]|uniref:hypothetical protein n=1 Tax=Nocardioides sp. TaxID=35761 RepID=UPI0039E52B92